MRTEVRKHEIHHMNEVIEYTRNNADEAIFLLLQSHKNYKSGFRFQTMKMRMIVVHWVEKYFLSVS